MFENEIEIERKEMMVQILSEDYLTKNSGRFGNVIVPLGEALLVVKDGNPQGEPYTGTAVKFLVKKDEPEVPQKKEGFFARLFKKKKKVETVSTDIDLTKNNVKLIRANLSSTKYKIEFNCRTSDFAVVTGVANVNAHINKENLIDLKYFEDRWMYSDGDFDSAKGKIKVVTITDIESIMAEETSARVGGLLSSIRSENLIEGTYRDTIRKAIDDMKPDWLKKGLAVENIDIIFKDTTYELSKMKEKELNDAEIGNEADFISKSKRLEREGKLKTIQTQNELELKLMEANGMKEVITANVSNLEDEIVKDNAHRRRIELLKAEVELEKAKKGYLEGYIEGYKDGQTRILDRYLFTDNKKKKEEEEEEE